MPGSHLWVGLDVGIHSMSACGVDDDGAVIIDAQIPTDASAFHGLLSAKQPRIKLVAMEAGACGIVLARSLRELGYRVAVLDTRQASKFLAIRQNKTDRNDARGLADIARLGRQSISEVRIKSPDSQRLKSTLVTRNRLVQLRVAAEADIRSVIRLNGGHLKYSKTAASLKRHVQEALRFIRKAHKIDLTDDIEPMLSLSLAIRAYVESIDDKLRKKAEDDPVCQ